MDLFVQVLYQVISGNMTLSYNLLDKLYANNCVQRSRIWQNAADFGSTLVFRSRDEHSTKNVTTWSRIQQHQYRISTGQNTGYISL
jgi:hypothetical protein